MRRMIYFVLLASFFLAACTGSTGEEKSITFAIEHVNLVPMTSEVILEDQTVLIVGSRIAAIGPAGDVDIPGDAMVIDGTDAYLMPGLADMHMHTTPAWETEWPISPFVLYLANGVTTVRNLDPLPDASGQDHPSPDYVLTWRHEIQSGKQPGPTMYTTGLSLQGPDDWRPSVIKPGDAESVVQQNVDKGYDLLKIFEYYPQEHFAEAMTAAKENGMYVTGHIPFAVGLEAAVHGGMDEIAHILPILIWERVGAYQPGMTRAEFMPAWQTAYLTQWEGIDTQTWYAREQETIERIIEILHTNDVNLCTTVAGPDITAHLITDYDSFIERVDMQYSRRRYLDLIARGEDSTQQAFSQNPGLLEHFTYERDVWLRELKDAVIVLILGTDSGIGMGLIPGFSVHEELLTMVHAGFTPYEAIATGTVNASMVVEQMTGVDDFGTIEVGKRADLILIGGNPLEDIANIQEIRGVMAVGRWYPRETLNALIALE